MAIKLIGDAYAFPGEEWLVCQPMAGAWFAAIYYTNGEKVVGIGCECRPCHSKGLFHKSCQSIKAYRQGKSPVNLRIAHEFGYDTCDGPPPNTLHKYAKWVSSHVVR